MVRCLHMRSPDKRCITDKKANSKFVKDTVLETLTSKYDFGPVKLPGLLRKGPQVIHLDQLKLQFNCFVSCEVRHKLALAYVEER